MCGAVSNVARPKHRKQTLLQYHARGDVSLETGSTVCWTSVRFDAEQGRRVVDVVCGRCKQRRTIQLRLDNINRERFTGFCTHCADHPVLYAHNSKGRCLVKGYIRLLVKYLPPDQKAMVAAMDRLNGTRSTTVAEHRLLKAMELGRPLRSDECVHHRDLGKDTNDDTINLELQSPGGHTTEHARIARRLQRELVRVYRLLDRKGVSYGRRRVLQHLPLAYQEEVRGG
jgi:hypothetical protein